MSSKGKSKKPQKPKLRIPLPEKPPKVEPLAKVYRRKKKYPEPIDEPDEDENKNDSEFSENN